MIKVHVNSLEQVVLDLIEIGDGLDGSGIHASSVVERLQIAHYSHIDSLTERCNAAKRSSRDVSIIKTSVLPRESET